MRSFIWTRGTSYLPEARVGIETCYGKINKINQDSEEAELSGGEQLIALSSYMLNFILIWTFNLNAIDWKCD